MPVDKIIGIPYLAQAVMAVLLREPDNARARPSTLIKNEDDYKRVFSEAIGFDVYLFCVGLLKSVEERLRTHHEEEPVELRRNIRYHVAMAYAVLAVGMVDYRPTDLKCLVGADIQEHLADDAIDRVIDLLNRFGQTHEWPLDRIVKSRDFRDSLVEELESKIQTGQIQRIPF